MSLTHNSRIIADPDLKGLSLHKIVGAFEFHFPVMLQLNTSDVPYEFQIDMARVTISMPGQRKHELGNALPNRVRFEQTFDFPSNSGVDLRLVVLPQQVSALEEIRDGGDLLFELELKGTSVHKEQRAELTDKVTLHVPRSEWIKQMRQSGFLDVLLLEVPFPALELPEKLKSVRAALEEAQRHFVSAEYTACVASCRTAIQEFGHHIYADDKWADEATKLIKGGARDLTKDQRAQAIFAMLRLYAHQSHHGPGEGGVVNYTRDDAQMILRMCAASIAMNL